MSSIIEIIHQTRASIHSVSDDKKSGLIDLIFQLANRVFESVKNLDQIPKNYSDIVFPSISNQLVAAEKRIEIATNVILDSADTISRLLPQLSGDAVKKEIQSELNKIFEASGFQDLVSQHLNEITIQMGDLSIDIDYLQSCLTSIDDLNAPAFNAKHKSKDKRSDAHLLNGPSTNI
jgi:chemotaxis regulatin CheY-phosphate phosphatase CheZ